jgi:hypothetical protein
MTDDPGAAAAERHLAGMKQRLEKFGSGKFLPSHNPEREERTHQ